VKDVIMFLIAMQIEGLGLARVSFSFFFTGRGFLLD